MLRIITILIILSTIISQPSTVFAQRLSENPTKPGWKFQGMSGKNWIQVGVYTDSAALAAAAIPRAWVGTTGADSTHALLAYTKTDSTFWGFSSYKWYRLWQLGSLPSTGSAPCDSCITAISFRPGSIVDTLYYTTANGEINWYYNVISDGLLPGTGIVTYTGTARTYFISAAIFRKNGQFYQTNDTTITIAALSNPDSSRSDVFVARTSGQVGTITGVESANPLTPQIDGDTEVYLTHVTLTPTRPAAGVDTVIIYDQNTEWTGSATGMTANFNNTSPTWRGSKSVDVGAVNNGDHLQFVNGSLLNRNSYAGISMFIRLKGILPNNNNLNVSFWNGSSQVSNMLNLPLTKGNTSSWQGVSLSFSSFTWTNDLFDRVRIQFAGSGPGTSGYYLDFVYLQNGISTPPPATNFLQDVRRTGDALEKQLNGTWTTWASISDKLNKADSTAGGYYPYSTNPKGYLQAADIAGKLNTSDTASMLNAYLRKADTSLMLNPYLRTAWFNGYFDARFATKTSDNLAEGSTNLYYTTARAALKLNISDSANMMRNAVRSVYRKAGSDSVFAVSGAGMVFAFRDSIGSGGGGGVGGAVNNSRLVFSANGSIKDTSTLVYIRSSGFVGINNQNPQYRLHVGNGVDQKAMGGNEVPIPGYRVHSFTSNGTFTVTSDSLDVEVLLVAGGGGGARGGGGAGGVISGTKRLYAGSYAVSVGNGGGPSLNGQNSSFSTFTAIGGGAANAANSGNAGGSGGGGGASGSSITSGGAGTAGQGNAGGSNAFMTSPFPSGGGGGAGAAGQNGQSSTQSGAGGNGILSSITGTATYYGGGGGGGTFSGGTGGAGGLGGGGTGGNNSINGTNGLPNTGGGGGGAGNGRTAGSGGSGIIIIRYVENSTPANFKANDTVFAGALNISSLQNQNSRSFQYLNYNPVSKMVGLSPSKNGDVSFDTARTVGATGMVFIGATTDLLKISNSGKVTVFNDTITTAQTKLVFEKTTSGIVRMYLQNDFGEEGVKFESGNKEFIDEIYKTQNSTTHTQRLEQRSGLMANSANSNTVGEMQFFQAANVTDNTKLYMGNIVSGIKTGNFVIDAGNLGIRKSSAQSTLDVNGSAGFATRSITGARTLDITDHSIFANATSAAFNVTLPTAVGITGRIYVIKKTDSSGNAVTVNTTSSQTIDGATTYSLATQYKYVKVQSDGANWQIIGNN